MSQRTVKPGMGDDWLGGYRGLTRGPAPIAEHKGKCGCGVETSRSVTIGPPGHPENGWECPACGELRLKFEMERRR